jgi:exopolysaccharide production protein ExoZ
VDFSGVMRIFWRLMGADVDAATCTLVATRTDSNSNMKTEVSQRSLMSIQVLRAVAALAIVIAHFWSAFEAFGHPNPWPNFILGAAGVDLFFVISGFIMVYSSEAMFGQPMAPAQFILRRLARIVPLYWAATTIWLCWILAYHQGLAPYDLDWRSVLASYVFLPYPGPSGLYQAPVLGVGWTLNYEMFFYAIFAVALLFPRRVAVIGISALFVTIVFIGHKLGPVPPNPMVVWANQLILEFAFGMVIAQVYRAGMRLPLWIAGMLIFSGVGLLCLSPNGDFRLLPRYLNWGGAAALIVAGFTLSKARAPNGRLMKGLVLLGDASYALYLTHAIVVAVAQWFVAPRMNPSTQPWLYAAFLLTLCLGTAIAVHLILERPLTRGLQKLINRVWKRPEAVLQPGLT